MRSIYTVLGAALIVTIPLAFLIPDAAREKRQSTARAADALAASALQASPSGAASSRTEREGGATLS